MVAMSARLDRLPDTVFVAVLEDLGGPVSVGRRGMPAEQVVRALVLRQLQGWSFDELAFHLEDSASCRCFCRAPLCGPTPSAGTLKRNVKMVSPGSLELLNAAIVQQGIGDGLESGCCIRGDSTVMETNIHAPTDSTLLWDAIRMLSGMLRDAARLCGEIKVVDHTRAGKRRMMDVYNAEGLDNKRAPYRALYKLTEATVHAAEQASLTLRERAKRSRIGERRTALAGKLEDLTSLAHRVLHQTRRRVFEGKPVASVDKVVSLSEPHTDIILKGKRQPQYGHKVFLASGRSGLILDCDVAIGNRADSREAVATIARVMATTHVAATEVSFDGGYASKDNVEALKALGVQEVAFHKKCGIKVEDMTSTPGIYKRLRNFRAAIEATIGWLKRSFGLRRCLQSGLASFKAHAQAAVIAANLLLLARLDLG